jgi:hypothetical protein
MMAENTMVNGIMENNMGKANILVPMGLSERGFGLMESE